MWYGNKYINFTDYTYKLWREVVVCIVFNFVIITNFFCFCFVVCDNLSIFVAQIDTNNINGTDERLLIIARH